MNPDLKNLQPYPFERLNRLKAGSNPPAGLDHIALSIGEPKHPAPDFVRQEMSDQLGALSGYPNTKGIIELRSAIAAWAQKRFNLAASKIPSGFIGSRFIFKFNFGIRGQTGVVITSVVNGGWCITAISSVFVVSDS